jgi:hypothetical protein
MLYSFHISISIKKTMAACPSMTIAKENNTPLHLVATAATLPMGQIASKQIALDQPSEKQLAAAMVSYKLTLTNLSN